MGDCKIIGPVAQLVERVIRIDEARSSNLLGSTNIGKSDRIGSHGLHL